MVQEPHNLVNEGHGFCLFTATLNACENKNRMKHKNRYVTNFAYEDIRVKSG